MKKFIKIIPVLMALCLLLAVGAYASGEPSGEASAEPVVNAAESGASGETSAETITFVYEGVEYTVPVYTFNGEEYVKLADLKAVLCEEEENASGEPEEKSENKDASGEPEEKSENKDASGEPEEKSENKDASGEPEEKSENKDASGEPEEKSENKDASGEPEEKSENKDASGEPEEKSENKDASGEPEEESENKDASGEASAEETAPVQTSFDVTVRINGTDYAVVPVTALVDGNTYMFQIGELLAAFDLELSYNEETDVASITADVTSFFGVLIAGASSAETEATIDEAAASEEPAASVEPETTVAADVIEEAAAVEELAESVPATDGTENQQNVLAATDQPATEGQYNAYEVYLSEYMTGYSGVGDGTFDDSARAMALAELESVGFGADVNAFPFEMFVTQFGAMDYATFAAVG